MDWRDYLYFDDLRRAKFRGVFFYIDSVDTGIGRRNIVHQYPFKDDPYVEDLGPDIDEFIINAYVIQSKNNSFDYTVERDKLASALRKTGPGTLIHPSYGEMQVSVRGKVRITESYSREGGIARFTITFVQSGRSRFPEAGLDHIATMDKASDDGISKVQDNYAGNAVSGSTERSSGQISSSPSESSFLNDARNGLKMVKNTIASYKKSVTSTVSKVLNQIDADIALLTNSLSSPCDFAAAIVSSIGRVMNLVGIPDTLYDRTVGRCSSLVYGSIRALPTDKVEQKLGISMCKGLAECNKFGTVRGSSSASIYGGEIEQVTINSPLTAREHFNQMKLVNLVREVSLLNAVKVAVRIDFESYDDAIDITETLSNALDDLLDRLGDQASDTSYDDYGLYIDNDNEYSVIDDVRSKFVRAMFDIGADLAKIENYTVPPCTTPTLVLAYRKYKDVDRSDEIQQRNRNIIENPCFIPEGKTIKILSV